MNIATVENLPAQSNRAVSNSWRIAQGVIWGGLAVVVLSGWFVVARLGLRQDLRVWDVMALRFGEGALFLTPVLLVGPLRLRVQAWPSGIILALLWGAPFILLVGLGLQATSATMTSTVTPALMPVFAGFAFNRAVVLLGSRAAAVIIAYAGYCDPLGDTGSRRTAIVAVGSRYLHHRVGGRPRCHLVQSG
jgi:hypothetical protein